MLLTRQNVNKQINKMNTLSSILLPYTDQTIQATSKTQESRKPVVDHSPKDLAYIRDSLTPDNCMTDSQLAARHITALPGYGEEETCSLCKIRSKEDCIKTRVTDTGCTLAEFLNEAHAEFTTFKGRPQMDIATEVTNNLKFFAKGQQKDLDVMLTSLTPENVLRHFKYDHVRQTTIKVKDNVMRILVNMLQLGISSCCEVLENGTTTLSKGDALLLLQIVDRIHKMALLKDDITV